MSRMTGAKKVRRLKAAVAGTARESARGRPKRTASEMPSSGTPTVREARAWQERLNAIQPDTADENVSATNLKSDAGASTARRNLKRDASDTRAALESSNPLKRPSRKSTRRSSSGALKSNTQKTIQVKRAVAMDPKPRAQRALARGRTRSR